MEGVDPKLVTFFHHFSHALTAHGYPHEITSTRRTDRTAHAHGLAIDIGLRNPRHLPLLNKGRSPRYHRDPQVIDKVRSALVAGRQVALRLGIAAQALIEHDHVHLQRLIDRAPGIYFGWYLPCETGPDCAPNVQPLTFRKL